MTHAFAFDTPARLIPMDPDMYHADPCPEPSLSASIAHTLVSKSPAHAWLQHPKLGGRFFKPTKEMDRGTLCHAILLGKGREFCVVEADDWRTKAAREKRDAARAGGLTPVLSHELESAELACGAIAQRLKNEFDIVLDGESEVAAFWSEATSDGDAVLCRAQMDHVKRGSGIAYDLKLARSAHPRACQSHMFSFGCDIQAAAYTSALEAALPEHTGRSQFIFLFCEPEEPYCVTPVHRLGTMRELGSMRWKRALRIWAQCRATNRWPTYVDHVIGMDAPNYALMAELELEGSDGLPPYVVPDGPVNDTSRHQPGQKQHDSAADAGDEVDLDDIF